VLSPEQLAAALASMSPEERVAAQAEIAAAMAVAQDVPTGALTEATSKAALEVTLNNGGGIDTATMEFAKSEAREMLSQALVDKAAGPQDGLDRPSSAYTKATEKKANLSATKDEMLKMNYTLKTEVDELSGNLENLEKQRANLREKMSSP